ncbi:MAG: hypothetical protein RIR97_815, partial [Pseudomonadota bacterium]
MSIENPSPKLTLDRDLDKINRVELATLHVTR